MPDEVQQKIQNFFRQFPVEKYQRDEVISRSGTLDTVFFYIEKGAVKMTTTSREGKDLVLHVYYPESCFSLLSLIHEGVSKYDFMAITDTTVYKAPKEKVIHFFKENADVAYDFQIRLLKGLQGLLNRIEQTTFVPTYNQVAGLLVYFARHFSESTSEQKIIQTRLTHQEISEWLGITRENVSIQMKQLERDGYIHKHENFIKILDITKLQKIADPYGLD